MKIKALMMIVAALSIVTLSVAPAMAYTTIGGSAVTITASGTITGSTLTFSAVVVDQATGSNQSGAIAFSSPNGVTDSGRAIKITGGTNEVDARVIIYTDNASQFNATTPEIDPATGADGAGLVGQSNKGYAVPMFWGVNSGSDYAPNSNVNYVFDGNFDDGIGEAYIVDHRHTMTYTTKSAVSTSLDSMPMYTLTGTTNINTPNDGLYPQAWEQDYYDKVPSDSTRVVVSQALYKNIATVAFGVGTGTGSDVNNYVCRVANMTTASSADNVAAKLAKITGSTGTDQYLYIYIGANFSGVPAQTYSTSKLMVTMVKG